jgi:TetR/AcrR family transcriptional regulator, cholesterol catabolism regulator
MAGIRRTGGMKKKHKEILDKAAVLFKEKGYKGVTMDDIGRALGISKLSLYYYFESKEDIIYYITEKGHNIVLQGLKRIAISKDPPETKLRKAIINYIDTVLCESTWDIIFFRQEYHLAPENRNRLIKKRDQYDKLFRGIIAEGIKKGVFIDCDPKMINFVLMGSLGSVAFWYSPKGPLTPEQIGNFFADVLTRALLRKPSGDGINIA